MAAQILFFNRFINRPSFSRRIYSNNTFSEYMNTRIQYKYNMCINIKTCESRATFLRDVLRGNEIARPVFGHVLFAHISQINGQSSTEQTAPGRVYNIPRDSFRICRAIAFMRRIIIIRARTTGTRRWIADGVFLPHTRRARLL